MEIKIGQIYKSKTGTPELYEVTAIINNSEIAVTRLQRSGLSIKVDALVNSLNFEPEFKNTILESIFYAKYGKDWRVERRGILWFPVESFNNNFKYYS